MAWSTQPPEIRELAKRVLTREQLDAVKLWEAGYGERGIGRMLGISRSAARDRLQPALEKLTRAARAEGLSLADFAQ